jgi:hypothetical protein
MPIPQKVHDFKVEIALDDKHSNNIKTTISGPSIYSAAKAYCRANPDIVGILYNGRWVD